MRSFVEKLWGVVVILGKPKSRGSVQITSRDPHAMPDVDPGWFADPADMDTVLAGVARARDIAGQPPLGFFGQKELLPGKRVKRRAALERWVRKNVMTTYHFAGSCAFGTKDDDVLDLDLRVRGIEGLRVADASAMPVAPVAALKARTMMRAYRAEQAIAADA